METVTIEKLDAASRQLNTAISLWFTEGDPVSIHTLACSAHQIVHDINQKHGSRDLLYDSIVIKDECRREVNKSFKHAYNFFKHADNDEAELLEFKPYLSELFMVFTSLGLELLGHQPDPIRSAFNIYYGLRNPHLLTGKGRMEWLDKISSADRELAMSFPRRDFFDLYLAARNPHLQNKGTPFHIRSEF